MNAKKQKPVIHKREDIIKEGCKQRWEDMVLDNIDLLQLGTTQARKYYTAYIEIRMKFTYKLNRDISLDKFFEILDRYEN